MTTSKLFELIKSDGSPIYKFYDVEPLMKKSSLLELECYGYVPKDYQDWREIALKETDAIELGKEEISGRILTGEKLNDLLQHNEKSYRNSEFWRFNRSGFGLAVNTTVICFGAIGGLSANLRVGVGAVAIGLVFNEINRRANRRDLEKQKANLMNLAGIYQNIRDNLKDAKIKIITPPEAVEKFNKLKKLSELVLINSPVANEYLRKTYQDYTCPIS